VADTEAKEVALECHPDGCVGIGGGNSPKLESTGDDDEEEGEDEEEEDITPSPPSSPL
jgi:hypothetical protein